MHKRLIYAVACLIFAPLLLGSPPGQQQAATPHQHSQPGTTVSGAEHPERVPEAVAYRTYFLGRAVSPDASAEAKHLNDLKLAEIGLDAADFRAFTKAMSDFYLQYTNLSEEHNRHAQAAEMSGRHGDVEKLHASIATLVEQIRTQLSATMSTNGQLKLKETVEREKFHMRISESEAQ